MLCEEELSCQRKSASLCKRSEKKQELMETAGSITRGFDESSPDKPGSLPAEVDGAK